MRYLKLFFVFITGHENELVLALQDVLSDDSFKVKAPPTIQSRKSAEQLLEWCLRNENKDRVNAFTLKLLGSLKGVIKASITKVFSYNTEKIWRNFFLLRSTPEFATQWSTFLSAFGEPVKPVLFQHLTDLVFRKCLDNHFKVMHQDKQVSSEDLELRATEKGVLYYVAGYICRQLRKKIERESHEFKEEMVLCLMELVKDHSEDTPNKDGTLETDHEHWTNLIDRGGLWHIKDTTYQLFFTIEQVVREVLMTIKYPTQPLKKDMIKKVVEDEDVQFYWLIVTADFEVDDEEVHAALLLKITELYVTVRGFSMASGLVEQYKQHTKKSTQRTKSLRRQLHDATQ